VTPTVGIAEHAIDGDGPTGGAGSRAAGGAC
jgi:hypothetical protein